MAPSALSIDNWLLLGGKSRRASRCKRANRHGVARRRGLGTHIRRASQNCHALRCHNGAHDGAGWMPPSALSVESCGGVVWRVARCFFLCDPPLQQSIFK